MRAGFLLCLGGPLCLYQGDELGLPESKLAEEDLRDPFGLHYWPAFAGRDGCRTPMPWREFEAHGGFSSQKPWLPLDPAHRELAVDAQEGDPGSVLSMWRELLSWRRCTFDATCRNVLRIYSFAPALAFLREGRSGPLLCAFNFEGREISLASGVLRGARVSRADHARLDGDTLGFAPNGSIVLELDPSAANALGCDKLRAR
jgi:alpha-glucosidase